MKKMKKGPESIELIDALKALKHAYSRTKKRVWLKAAQLLQRPRRRRVEVNVYALDKHVAEGDFVLVPGKVLSLGKLSKKITVAAFSAAAGARKKIAESGSKLLSLQEAAEKSDGKKVKIVI